MTTHNFIDNLVESCESTDEDRLLGIMCLVKTVVATLVFLGIVVVWDTLPARAPISDVEQQAVIVSPGNAALKFNLTVQKLVDFKISYTIKSATGRSVQGSIFHIQDNEKVPYELTLLSPTVNLPATGTWCVSAVATWENGLSIRQHSKKLDEYCFNS